MVAVTEAATGEEATAAVVKVAAMAVAVTAAVMAAVARAAAMVERPTPRRHSSGQLDPS